MGESTRLYTKASEAKRENPSSPTERSNFSTSENSSIDQILFLQRIVGNRAVNGLLKSGVIPAKLTNGQPGGVYEREAVKVSNDIIQASPTTVQRQEYFTIPSSQSPQPPSQTAPGREPTRGELREWGDWFPNLTGFRILREPEGHYNCFAWAVGIDNRLITYGTLKELGYSHDLDGWTRYLSDQHGFVWHADGPDERADLVLFGGSKYMVEHAARKAEQPFGKMTFSSKLGGGNTKSPVILHALLELEGKYYGNALRSFWRASKPVPPDYP